MRGTGRRRADLVLCFSKQYHDIMYMSHTHIAYHIRYPVTSNIAPVLLSRISVYLYMAHIHI